MNIIIQATNVMWTVQRTAGGRLVAWCDPLGLTLEADDDDELHSLIGEAHHTLFVDLLEDGELQRFLLDRGWQPNVPLPPRMPEDGVHFALPYKTAAGGVHGHP